MVKPQKEYPYQNLFLNDIQGEQWEDIPDLDGYYCISNFGRTRRMAFEIVSRNGVVRKIREKIIKQDLETQKNKSVDDEVYFLRVSITLAGTAYKFSVARLVYYLFLQKFDLSDPSLVVLTKDCDGRNIYPDNLRLVDVNAKQQRIYDRNRLIKEFPNALEEYLNDGIIQSSNPFCKQVTQFSLNGRKIQTFPSSQVAARVLNVNETGINSVLKGRQLSSHGFVWRYGEQTTDIETPGEAGKRNPSV